MSNQIYVSYCESSPTFLKIAPCSTEGFVSLEQLAIKLQPSLQFNSNVLDQYWTLERTQMVLKYLGEYTTRAKAEAEMLRRGGTILDNNYVLLDAAEVIKMCQSVRALLHHYLPKLIDTHPTNLVDLMVDCSSTNVKDTSIDVRMKDREDYSVTLTEKLTGYNKALNLFLDLTGMTSNTCQVVTSISEEPKNNRLIPLAKLSDFIPPLLVFKPDPRKQYWRLEFAAQRLQYLGEFDSSRLALASWSVDDDPYKEDNMQLDFHMASKLLRIIQFCTV
jgi:hypothetical protein